MKMKQLKLLFVSFFLVSFAFICIHFELFQWSKQPVISSVSEVHETYRVHHAKELLGEAYAGSPAHEAEGKNTLHQLVQRNVYRSLKPRWRHQTRKIAQTIISESARKKMDPFFVLAIIKTESKFNPQAIGIHGEVGLMQIKPSTAKWIAQKYKIPWQGEKDLRNPVFNIKVGIAYMDYLRAKFNKKALTYVSAYNIGPQRAKKIKEPSKQSYSAKVLDSYMKMYKHNNLIAYNNN